MIKAFEPIPDSFVTKVKFYDYKVPITEAIESINLNGAAVVVKNKKYFGVVDDRAIARAGGKRLTEKFSIGKFAVKLPLINSSSSIGESIRLFHDVAAKVLPYTEGNTIKGVIKREKVLSAMLSLHLLAGFKAADAMSSPVVAIDADANAAQALAAMRQNKINRLVVLSSGKIFGMLTYKNLAKLLANPVERAPKMKERIYTISNTPVSSICERSVYSIEYNRPMEDAIRDFVEHEISSLLVVRSGKPVGILTVRDTLELFAMNSAEQNEKIVISGLDDYTKEYEQDVVDKMNELADKASRFTRVGIDRIFLHVKRTKARNYEMHGRVELAKKGSISATSSGYSLNDALSELYDRLYKRIKERKEIIIAYKKSGERGNE